MIPSQNCSKKGEYKENTMKKLKKTIGMCIAFALILTTTACGNNTQAQGANNPDQGTFTIEEIQHAPTSYVGNITLVGTVAQSSSQPFALQNDAGTFDICVDYRGSQALPAVGYRVVVEGMLTENRPCCGEGFTLMSTHFALY